MLHVHGSGTIDTNRDDIEKIFTKELISRSVKTQKELIRKAVKILKNGGELIYSTCSILKEENENIIKEVLKMQNVELVPIDKTKFEGVEFLPVSIDGTICIAPNELYEGFFVAKIRKS